MRDTVEFEKKNKPVVVAITEEFVAHGKNIAHLEGHANMRQLVFPYPLEGLPPERLHEIAVAMYPKFLQAIGAEFERRAS